jgi:hypothetical protein
MTGLELKRIFDLQVDKDYTGYWDNIKLNRIFARALINAMEKIYRNLSEQGEYDELRGFIKVNRTFTPATFNILYTDITATATPNIQDYYHLLHVSAQFNEPLYNVNVVSATNASPIVVTFSGQNNIRTGDKLFFSGAVGNTNLNGLRYPKKVKNNVFALYLDENFQTTVTGNGAYTTLSASVARYWYEACQRYFSDRKNTQFGSPSASNPKFEQQNGTALTPTMMLFHPLTLQCNQVSVDYISQPPQVIDVADNVIDLERWYDKTMLYLVVEQASLLAAQQIRDGELYQSTAAQIVQQ